MGRDARRLVVIGGGAGGVAAAVRASQLGAQAVLVEREDLGGTCMNRGCIPTKSLMETARLLRRVRKAGDFGLRVSDVEVDWDAVMSKKDDIVRYLRMGTEALLRSNKVEIRRGDARFETPTRIRVGEEILEPEAVIVATGSHWAPPEVEGIGQKGVITTDELLNLREIPPSVAVLGSGPVELEAAQYLLFLGSRVSLLEQGSRIVPDEDREMSSRLSSALKEQGIELHTGVRAVEVRRDKKGLVAVRLQGKDGEEWLRVDCVLHARRRPWVEGLGLDAAGVVHSGEGIRIDDYLRTSVPHILAIGDATGGPMYSHRASAMGIVAAENALGEVRPFKSNAIPRAFFTLPEMAAVGLTEREAKRQGHDLRVSTIPYGVNARAMMMLETGGAVKIVAESRYGEVLGVHVVGPHASELIAEGVLAVELEATVDELSRAVRLHPSLSESQVDAARETLGRGIYVLR